MVGLAWAGRLETARSVNALVSVAQEYVATWTAIGLAKLPNGLRPPSIGGPDDIAAYALDLVQRQCSGRDSSEELTRMASFFAAAAHRQSLIISTSKAKL